MATPLGLLPFAISKKLARTMSAAWGARDLSWIVQGRGSALPGREDDNQDARRKRRVVHAIAIDHRAFGIFHSSHSLAFVESWPQCTVPPPEERQHIRVTLVLGKDAQDPKREAYR